MNDEKRATPFWLAALLLAALLVPCLYVASIGPVVRYTDDSGSGIWRVVYAPLAWVHDHTPLERPLEWYVGIWMELPGPRD